MLAEGKTEQEIKDYFGRITVRAYFLNLPHGFQLAGLSCAAGVDPCRSVRAFNAFKEWTKPKSAEAGSGQEMRRSSSDEDDYIQRLEEELKNRK